MDFLNDNSSRTDLKCTSQILDFTLVNSEQSKKSNNYFVKSNRILCILLYFMYFTVCYDIYVFYVFLALWTLKPATYHNVGNVTHMSTKFHYEKCVEHIQKNLAPTSLSTSKIRN